MSVACGRRGPAFGIMSEGRASRSPSYRPLHRRGESAPFGVDGEAIGGACIHMSGSTVPSIEGLSAVFGIDRTSTHFSVPLKALNNLQAMCMRLAGGPNLLGMYIPESTEPDYNSDEAQYGRVLALARVLPMPPGHIMANFPSGCLEYRDGTLADRWPIGWPCEVVFHSLHGGPVLRDGVYKALGISDFASFAVLFIHGPIILRPFPALRQWLMTEVRHQIARDPTTMVRPF